MRHLGCLEFVVGVLGIGSRGLEDHHEDQVHDEGPAKLAEEAEVGDDPPDLNDGGSARSVPARCLWVARSRARTRCSACLRSYRKGMAPGNGR